MAKKDPDPLLNHDIAKIIRQLKQLQQEKSLSYAEIAKQIGVSEQFLIMVELGEIIPTEKQIEAMMQYIIDQI